MYQKGKNNNQKAQLAKYTKTAIIIFEWSEQTKRPWTKAAEIIKFLSVLFTSVQCLMYRQSNINQRHLGDETDPTLHS